MKTRLVIIATALVMLISAIKTEEQQTHATGFVENSTNITTLRSDANPDSYVTTLNATETSTPGRPKEKLPRQLHVGEEGEEEGKEREDEKTREEEEKKMKNEKEEKIEEKKVKREKGEGKKVVNGEEEKEEEEEEEEEIVVRRVDKREKEKELRNEAESVDNGREKRDKQGKHERKHEQQNMKTVDSEEETKDDDDDDDEEEEEEEEEEIVVRRVDNREKEKELKNEAESVDNGREKGDKQGKHENKHEQQNMKTVDSEEELNSEEETEDDDDDAAADHHQDQDQTNLEEESVFDVSDYQNDYGMIDDDYRKRRESRGMDHLGQQARLFRSVDADDTFENWAEGRENEILDMIRVLGENSDLPYKDEHFASLQGTSPPDKNHQNKNGDMSFHDRKVFEYGSNDYFFDQDEDVFDLNHSKNGDGLK